MRFLSKKDSTRDKRGGNSRWQFIVLSCALLSPVTLPAPVFIKIPDIDGESADQDHDKWIDVIGFQGGLEENTSSGSREHKPMTVHKRVDKASPLLMEALTSGKVIGEIILEGERTTEGDSSVPYYRYKLENARVTSYEVEDSEATGDQPVEEFSLNYSRAEYHVQEIGPDGTVIDRVSTYFDSLLSESGVIPQAPVIEQAADINVGTGQTFMVDLMVKDFDTPYLDLDLDLEIDPVSLSTDVGPLKWMAPESLRLTATTTPYTSGQTTVTLHVGDGSSQRSMSFSVFIDSINDPFDGFTKAYFTEEERNNPDISSPIADPDQDNLSTLMEFLFGTNPREFTPPEEQLRKTPIHIAPPDGGGTGSSGMILEFRRRIDDPRIRLVLFGSPDGDNWTRLSDDPDNPLYEENASKGENPLFENVSGTVRPPDGVEAYFIRFVAEMN